MLINLSLDQWIQVTAVIVTLVLAMAAFAAIRQNSRFQKLERKRRLLDEVIAWATEVLTLGPEVDREFLLQVEPDVAKGIFIIDLIGRFDSILKRGAYVERVALKLDGKLHSAVESAMQSLSNHISLIEKSKPHASSLVGMGKLWDNKISTLDPRASLIIELATNIKCRDIG